jgi:hypothetical protein
MNVRDAEAALNRSVSSLVSVEQRIASVKRQIEIQQESHALIPRNYDDNKTILYYLSEKERVSKKMEIDQLSIENQIAALETKKRAAISAIENDYDNKIAALEGKKNLQLDKLSLEGERYIKEIERVQAQLNNPDPQTTPFRKLRADEAKLEKEFLDAKLDYADRTSEMSKAVDRQSIKAKDEAEQVMLRAMREENRRQDEERRRIEQGKENERRQEAERAAAHCKEAKETWKAPINAPAPAPLKSVKKMKGNIPSLPLDIKKKYRYDDLMAIEIDYDIITDQEETIYDMACAYAARRENISGWMLSKHNKYEGVDMLMSDEDFALMFK